MWSEVTRCHITVSMYGKKGSVHGPCLNLKWSNNGWKYIDAFYTYSGKNKMLFLLSWCISYCKEIQGLYVACNDDIFLVQENWVSSSKKCISAF